MAPSVWISSRPDFLGQFVARLNCRRFVWPQGLLIFSSSSLFFLALSILEDSMCAPTDTRFVYVSQCRLKHVAWPSISFLITNNYDWPMSSRNATTNAAFAFCIRCFKFLLRDDRPRVAEFFNVPVDIYINHHRGRIRYWYACLLPFANLSPVQHSDPNEGG